MVQILEFCCKPNRNPISLFCYAKRAFAALRPELQTQSSQLYIELQALPFVEEFPDKGHNVHDLTRNLMLKHLRLERRDEFLTLSQRAVEYFGSANEQPETQIEWLYHLIVVDRE